MADTGGLSPAELKVLRALKSAEVYLKLGGVTPAAWRAWRRDFDRLFEAIPGKDNQDFVVAVIAVIYLFMGRYPNTPDVAWEALRVFDIVREVVRGPLEVWVSDREVIADHGLNDATRALLGREGYIPAWGVDLMWANPNAVASIVRAVMPVRLWQGDSPGRATLFVDEALVGLS